MVEKIGQITKYNKIEKILFLDLPAKAKPINFIIPSITKNIKIGG